VDAVVIPDLDGEKHDLVEGSGLEEAGIASFALDFREPAHNDFVVADHGGDLWISIFAGEDIAQFGEDPFGFAAVVPEVEGGHVAGGALSTIALGLKGIEGVFGGRGSGDAHLGPSDREAKFKRHVEAWDGVVGVDLGPGQVVDGVAAGFDEFEDVKEACFASPILQGGSGSEAVIDEAYDVSDV